jgi:hypothetical protein
MEGLTVSERPSRAAGTVASLLVLVGSLLAIAGFFLPWSRNLYYGYSYTGWELITGYLAGGNLVILLILILGILAFLEALVLALAFARHATLVTRKRIAYVSTLEAFAAVAVLLWYWNVYRNMSVLPYGIPITGLGLSLFLAGCGIVWTVRKPRAGSKPNEANQ